MNVIKLVSYENQFNEVALKSFTANQLNLLLSISSKVCNKNITEVEFSYRELKDIINMDYEYSVARFTKEIMEVNKKLLALNFTLIDDDRIIQFALFTVFETIPKLEKLIVSVNPRFTFLFNNLTSRFTQFELNEFVNLKSSYTKEFFRRMKQFKHAGVWHVSLEEFKRLLDIPNSYSIDNINQRVIKPILKELNPRYNISINKITKKNELGGRPRITHFEFRFLKEKRDNDAIENKSEKYLRLIDEKTGKYAKFQILHTTNTDDGKFILKLKSTKSDTEITQVFNHLNHYTNFLMKFSV